MSYEVIRQRLARCLEDDRVMSADEKILLESLRQLTSVLESDLTQIKVALRHVARLLESGTGWTAEAAHYVKVAGTPHCLKFPTP